MLCISPQHEHRLAFIWFIVCLTISPTPNVSSLKAGICVFCPSLYPWCLEQVPVFRVCGVTDSESTHQFSRRGLAPSGGLSSRALSEGLIQERHFKEFFQHEIMFSSALFHAPLSRPQHDEIAYTMECREGV